MNLIWTGSGPYRRVGYSSEADLEAAILQVQTQLFGSNRIYLDVKKKIGTKSGLRNIPDGYLLDLGGRKPRLYVVENELASHEPLRHIMRSQARCLQIDVQDHVRPSTNSEAEVGRCNRQVGEFFYSIFMAYM